MSHPRIPERNEAFRDARNLLHYVIKRVIPGAPDPTPVQYEICQAMQTAMEPVVFPQIPPPVGWENNLVIEGFRGVAKSLIASVAGPLWGLYWNPYLNFFIVSASKERADAFSTFTLRCIRELPALQWMMPGDNSRDSMVAFDVGPAPAAHAPSVRSIGVTGMMTGSRGDIVIADDIEVPNNSETDVKRLRLAELSKEFASIAKPLSAKLALGTPQIEDTLYDDMVRRGYARIIWPARYPNEDWMASFGHQLSPMLAAQLKADPSLVGKPTDPARFNELVLIEKEAEYGRSGFEQQFMLDTRRSNANRYPLKLADLIVTEFSEERAPIDLVHSNDKHNAADIPSLGIGGDRLHRPANISADLGRFEGAVMTIDPSGRGSDALGICISKLLASRIFIPLLKGLQGGYQDSNLIWICEQAKAFGVKKIVPEDNFGNGMFTALLIPHLKRIYPNCAIEEIHSVGQKEVRIIQTLEPAFNQHKVVFHPKVFIDDLKDMPGISLDEAITYRLGYQITHLTKDRGCLRHDDLVDVLSMGVSFWVNHMKVTSEQAAKNSRAAEADEIYRSWYRESANVKPSSGMGHNTRVHEYALSRLRKR